MNDFDFQFKYVFENSWRLLALQDRDPTSPTYGCFDYKYWRDKTSEFPDARFQEAGATLYLLAANANFKHEVSDNLGSPRSDDWLQAFEASISFLRKIQYKNGSFDEWYKGERGFAATEFIAIAYSACLLHPEGISDTVLPTVKNIVNKACEWLSSRHDLVKGNHEAAAAAALAMAGRALDEKYFLASAKDKIENLSARQVDEGWFPEVGGMDLGYCSVTLDYVMLYVEYSRDQKPINMMRKLFHFMHPFIQPDLTIASDAGLCMNPYLSRLGMGLLSQFDQAAANIVFKLQNQSPALRGLEPTMADDLRMCRWSYLPVLVNLVKSKFVSNSRDVIVANAGQWSYFKESSVALYSDVVGKVYFYIAGGGNIKIYSGKKCICDFRGLVFGSKNSYYSSRGYSRARKVGINRDSVDVNFSLVESKSFNPRWVSRLLLRLACTTEIGSNWSRKAIDFYRVNNGTALNQSSTPSARGRNLGVLKREITITGQKVLIKEIADIENTDSIDEIYLQVFNKLIPLASFSLKKAKLKIETSIDRISGEIAILKNE